MVEAEAKSSTRAPVWNALYVGYRFVLSFFPSPWQFLWSEKLAESEALEKAISTFPAGVQKLIEYNYFGYSSI